MIVGGMPATGRRQSGPRARRAADGFTLLEAIVALVVFTMGAFALSGWLSTNVITLGRIKGQQVREQTLASALDLVRRSNPMQDDQGLREVGDLRVKWNATLVQPAKMAVSQSGEPGLYAVGLYEMDVQVTLGKSDVQRFKVRQVGWRQVRANAEP